MCRVALGGRSSVERVSLGDERCLPACTRRRSVAGRLWRRARSVERVDIEVDEGRLSGIAVAYLLAKCVVVMRRVVDGCQDDGNGGSDRRNQAATTLEVHTGSSRDVLDEDLHRLFVRGL